MAIAIGSLVPSCPSYRFFHLLEAKKAGTAGYKARL